MTDIATATPQPPQATSASASIDSHSVISSSQSDMNQIDDAAVTKSQRSNETATSESSPTPPPVPENKAPPKPAFAWGKPVATSNDIGNDTTAATSNATKTATSLLSIMQEEQELSKAQQAQKEEDNFMKQAIQQSLALQQQEEDELALALRLSQLDAGVGDVDMMMVKNDTSMDQKLPAASNEANLNLKQAPITSDDDNLNLKQPPATIARPNVAATAAASLPETSASIAAASIPEASGGGLSEEELASIQLAIQQAEDEELQKSLQLAMQLEMENESLRKNATARNLQNQGNVRVISREEYLLEQKGLLLKKDHGEYQDYHQQEQGQTSGGGFRINAQHASNWTRLDGFVVGPNDEIRTKHDPELQGQANAHRLHLDEYDEYDNETGGVKKMKVGNKAYNSFQQTMKKKTVKGVASHGQGRANTDTEKTKEGALDSRVRLLIGKTINQDWIDEFHGCVKEGKEALVYHATSGSTADEEMGVGQLDITGTTNVGDFEKGKYDVAVKVFKRIQEFRNRGQYVQGDPRYHSQEFSFSSGRAQLELWAEKEYRNLIRAYRVGIPVPQPLLQRENVVFLRFLGQDGWPCPQLREVKMKKKSHKWMALYQQTMEAIQTLYQEARLVHGDLSEYNLLVCPSHLLLRKAAETSTVKAAKEATDGKTSHDSTEEEKEEGLDVKILATDSNRFASGDDEDKAKTVEFAKTKEDYDPNALQIALIDFGQAVDPRHPQAMELLERDLLRVKQFFTKMGITTLSAEAAMTYVTTKGAPLLI